MARPKSIAEIAEVAKTRKMSFELAVREFLDTWQTMSADHHRTALAKEPERLDTIQNAYLAGLAEHLALSERMDVPTWTETKERFLAEPFFAGGLESLKATLLVESPLAFRRRLIFISANALSRPRREFIQDNALNVVNLDV